MSPREVDFWWKQWFPVLVSGEVPPVGGPQPAPVRIDFYSPDGLPHDPDPRRAVRHEPYFSGSSGLGAVPSVTARHVDSGADRGLVFVLTPGYIEFAAWWTAFQAAHRV
ncbi:hypothetical protein [Yinghuangia sp. YIM S09857]|uniref:hypothetical protein n=1 Tax=Yinghuangia sp. YIM S09857 TaxID=3436929 RepID=UPI003F53E0C1